MNYVKWLPVLLLAGCGQTPAPQPETAKPVRVSAVAAVSGPIAGEIEAVGTVTAKVTAAVSAREAGHIRELRVQEGDAVTAGQTIAVLDGRDIETSITQAEAARAEAEAAIPEAEAAIRAARAQLELANVSLGRMTKLKESGSVTTQEFDVAQAQARAAQSQLEMAQARRRQTGERVSQAAAAVQRAALRKGDTVVTAPFAGAVIARRAEPGVFASPGMPIVILERAGEWRLDVPVAESLLPNLKRGVQVRTTLDATGQDWTLPVTEILPSVDAANRTATVRIALPAGAGLRSGLSGRIRFPGAERTAVMIDSRAVTGSGQIRRVFLAATGRARGQWVTLGTALDGRVEVLSGVEPGDLVILNPPAGLADGARIEVAQ